MAIRSLSTEQGAALEWAAKQFSYDKSELVRKSLWGYTYRLSSASDVVWLKVLPEQQQTALRFAPLLADAFSMEVPAVIAQDEETGAMLLRDHGGVDLGQHPPQQQRRQLLRTYASMQVRAAKNDTLLTALPELDIKNLLPRLFYFLSSDKDNEFDPHIRVRARHFLGSSESRRYRRALMKRRDLLEAILDRAGQLPLTLNHCDLRTGNAAVLDQGSIVLFDWDDAVAGPAGISLHSMFSGSLRPVQLLAGGSLPEDDRYSRLLSAYVTELEEGGYADRDELYRSIPGSACAGVLNYLLSYAAFPGGSKRYRESTAGILRKRLSDLLDVCDHFSSQDRRLVLEHANDYQRNGRAGRAESLLRKFLRSSAADATVLGELADIQRFRGKNRRAIENYHAALRIEPDNGSLLAGCGRALLQDLRFSDAITHLQQAIECSSENTEIRADLRKAELLQRMEHNADEPDRVPTISIEASEIEYQKIDSEKAALAAQLFRRYGVLLIENVFDVNLIQTLNNAFLHKYADYLEDKKHTDALRVGDKRFMITLDFEAPFNSPQVFGNSLINQIIDQILGPKKILGSFTSVVSLPGSKSQSLHKDHPALFPESGKPSTRCFAVTMIVPLIDLDKSTGGTRFKKGSHLCSSKETEKMSYQDTDVPAGACFFMDYRLSHRGRANRSEVVRPILSIVYHRPWFRDYVNYEKQPPLSLSHAQFEQIPQQHQAMFAWSDGGNG
jgi:ectoine hydroxylase-related dioxygenase (phytanoyl-CoA dioxygenase family)